MPTSAVINPRRHRLLRTRVSRSENGIVVALFITLALTVAWVVSTRDNYDPGDRDIAPELLAKTDSERALYVPPLKVLDDPNAAPQSTAPVAALAPFPTAIVSDGWSLGSRVRRFDEDTLFEKINGEAPKFLKQGFQSMWYVVLASAQTSEEIGIELFDQSDRGGSLGIFSDHQTGATPVESMDGVDFFRTSIGAIGRRGRYFFRIYGDAETTSVREKSVQLAASMSALPGEASAAPLGMEFLTGELGFDPRLVSFQKANVFKFDFASNFWFAKANAEAKTRFFLHESESGDDAKALFDRLLGDLAFDFELIDEDIGEAILHHDFLKNYFALGVSNQWVFGIENAESQADAEAAIERFRNINGEDG